MNMYKKYLKNNLNIMKMYFSDKMSLMVAYGYFYVEYTTY